MLKNFFNHIGLVDEADLCGSPHKSAYVKRLKIFKELAWTLHNDAADIPLLYEVRFTGISDKIQGYGPPPGYSYSESGEYFKRVWIK